MQKSFLKNELKKKKYTEIEDLTDEGHLDSDDCIYDQSDINAISQAWFDNIKSRVEYLVCETSSLNENYFHFPEIISHIRHITRTITLWSALMVQPSNYEKKRHHRLKLRVILRI